MKKNLFAIAALLCVSLNVSAGVIALTPSNATPTVGDTFTVQLAVTGNTDEILGFGLDYSITGAAITLQGFTINPFFGADLGLTNTQIAAITFPGDTSGTVNLVSFSFLAAAPGSATFSVSSILEDLNEGLFGLTDGQTDLSKQVTINVSDTPEPATWLMLASGGLLLFVGRLRRS